MKILVLGAGMVGKAMALDLAKNHEVTSADKNSEALKKVELSDSSISTQLLDASVEKELKTVLKPYDLIVSAVPGFLGYEVLKTIIESGKDVVDISFFPEDGLLLDKLARAKGVTVIIDCGVAPGMGNLILGQLDTQMKVTDFECLVGGLPKHRKWPFCYKAPFSPVDVIEEYTRPARYVENSQTIVKPALTDCEYVEFEKTGTLESFNSDGLRSIIQTMPHIPNMKEKTLRYPGHVEYIRVLKESGFFDQNPVDVNGVKISPLDFTSAVLFNEWKLGEEEQELTVMRVTVKGKNSAGQVEKVVYHLFDEYDKATKTSSMARTTGYTATAVANILLERIFNDKGVFPPELLGRQEACFGFVMNYLNERGVVYRKEREVLSQ